MVCELARFSQFSFCIFKIEDRLLIDIMSCCYESWLPEKDIHSFKIHDFIFKFKHTMSLLASYDDFRIIRDQVRRPISRLV